MKSFKKYHYKVKDLIVFGVLVPCHLFLFDAHIIPSLCNGNVFKFPLISFDLILVVVSIIRDFW